MINDQLFMVNFNTGTQIYPDTMCGKTIYGSRGEETPR